MADPHHCPPRLETTLRSEADKRESRWVSDAGTPLAEVVGAVQGASLDPEVPLVLSRFAWLRRDGDMLVAESARRSGRLNLVDPRAGSLVLRFVNPRSAADAAAAEPSLPEAPAIELAGLLLACGVLLVASDAPEEEELPLAVWEFHDLLFHARSRAGRDTGPAGGTYRFVGRIEPAPALPPARWPQALKLERPDFARMEREDPSLSAVQVARRSVRKYGEPPIDVQTLGEFLYRVARVDDVWMAPELDAAHPTMFVARPYPSGGALYELECYVVVQRCDGADPGLYHYDPGEHALELVRLGSAQVDALAAREAMGAGVRADQIQLLLLITARMHRIAWKYASLAYALVLKHVGVLIDTMYLAATAMELAPCAIGSGHSDLFATVSGIDYYEEPLVGEFLLGRLPLEPAGDVQQR
jgi:SagB-type dehydrogenase family enzyme